MKANEMKANEAEGWPMPDPSEKVLRRYSLGKASYPYGYNIVLTPYLRSGFLGWFGGDGTTP